MVLFDMVSIKPLFRDLRRQHGIERIASELLETLAGPCKGYPQTSRKGKDVEMSVGESDSLIVLRAWESHVHGEGGWGMHLINESSLLESFLVKRVYIPKGNGEQRPLGIPTVEDKLVQMCFARILEAVYEPDFMGFTYGFRAKKNCHQALARRLKLFGFELSPGKTKIVGFGRGVQQEAEKGGEKPGTFNFLGFTHTCARSRKGSFKVGRKTEKKRFARGIKKVKTWLKCNRNSKKQKRDLGHGILDLDRSLPLLRRFG